MSILLALLACSTAAPDPLVGCWANENGRSTECFEAGGKYRLSSTKLGDFDGKWEREGGSVVITVGQFPSDTYAVQAEGDLLTLTHESRGAKGYTRLK
ncbi:MAG: hypothetical protein H6737_06605 [Alphaproteobacteria bacterium]|nr:hypothetical protein [Alphaproteobacteria bacterium]